MLRLHPYPLICRRCRLGASPNRGLVMIQIGPSRGDTGGVARVGAGVGIQTHIPVAMSFAPRLPVPGRRRIVGGRKSFGVLPPVRVGM